jgi:hypothetical protein
MQPGAKAIKIKNKESMNRTGTVFIHLFLCRFLSLQKAEKQYDLMKCKFLSFSAILSLFFTVDVHKLKNMKRNN